MPVIIYYPDAAITYLRVQFDDANTTVVPMYAGKDYQWFRWEATDAAIAAKGLLPGSYTAAILHGFSLVGVVASFDWDGSLEVAPASRLVVGVPVTEIWNVYQAQLPIHFSTTVLGVTSIAPDRSGVLYVQPGQHISIESDRIDSSEIDTYVSNLQIQVFRRNVPTRD